jgi:dinuclear metal center YbgI/SA1388 family protein
MTDAESIASYLDEFLRTQEVQDYPGAVNGLQLTNAAPITRVAAAVDFSLKSVNACIDAGANLLIVHHGMFWGGSVPFVGSAYRKIKTLIEKEIAVYSSHLPLDLHPEVGNNVLLARKLGLDPVRGFAHSKGVAIGTAGDCDIPTSQIVEKAKSFAAEHGGSVVATSLQKGRTTRKWGMCTGAGAGSETLAEARAAGIDTLVVGEGPHWTAVAAEDDGLCIIYAGHYATETLGVQAISAKVSEKFGMPWSFIPAPTGL